MAKIDTRPRGLLRPAWCGNRVMAVVTDGDHRGETPAEVAKRYGVTTEWARRCLLDGRLPPDARKKAKDRKEYDMENLPAKARGAEASVLAQMYGLTVDAVRYRIKHGIPMDTPKGCRGHRKHKPYKKRAAKKPEPVIRKVNIRALAERIRALGCPLAFPRPTGCEAILARRHREKMAERLGL